MPEHLYTCCSRIPDIPKAIDIKYGIVKADCDDIFIAACFLYISIKNHMFYDFCLIDSIMSRSILKEIEQ